MVGDARSRRPSQDYQAGSRQDFDRLYEETNERLFATLVTLLGDRAAAEDCLQNAYLRAFKAWSGWRGDAPAEAWLHHIAINEYVSYRRRERLRRWEELIRLSPPVVPDPTESSLPDLVRELRALPPKQAGALVLRYVHGYTNREIAHAIGVPERTIASRLDAARRRLQSRLRDRSDSGASSWQPRRASSDK